MPTLSSSVPRPQTQVPSTVAGEGGVRPALLRARLDRHHVLVGHQQDRRQLRPPPLPGVEQAVAADRLAGQRGVHPGKALLEILMEPVECRGLDVLPVLMRDGGEADRPRETPGGRAGVHREIGHRRRLDLMGLDQDHPQQEDGHQQEQDEAEGDGEDFLHGDSGGGSYSAPPPGHQCPGGAEPRPWKIRRRQEPRRLPDLRRLLERVGELDQRRLAPGAADEGDPDRQPEGEAGRAR